MQKGVAPILIVFLIAILAVGGYFVYQNKTKPVPQNQPVTSQSTPTPASDETANWKTYKDSETGFSFKYPGETNVEIDNELKLSNRSKINVSQGFTELLGYAPPKIINAARVIDKNKVGSANDLVFDIWIFENPDNIDINNWYRRYMYYPFTWGKSIESEADKEKPDKSIYIDNQKGQYEILQQRGPVRYSYVNLKNKMFLFRLLENQDGDRILSTFKFTQ